VQVVLHKAPLALALAVLLEAVLVVQGKSRAVVVVVGLVVVVLVSLFLLTMVLQALVLEVGLLVVLVTAPQLPDLQVPVDLLLLRSFINHESTYFT
jgi:hypothetical protein